MRAAAERFSSQTSLHGAYYVGQPRVGITQRSVWLIIMTAALSIMTLLLTNTLSSYMEYKTSIEVTDLGLPLVMYAVIECLYDKEEVYFMNISLQEEVIEFSNGRMHLSSAVRNAIYDEGFEYNNETKALFHKNLFRVLAAQWQPGELIPFIQWNGFDSVEADNEKSVYQELGFGTDYGVCTWITPYFRNPLTGYETDLGMLKLGALNGDNNGLSLLLDAETYDNAIIDDKLGSRVGQGFKVSVVHNLDIPLVRQSGLHVSVGTNVQLGVDITKHTTTYQALTTYSPVYRQCWNTSEINFQFLKYEYDYQYNMNNCLYEAALQKSEKECKCLPGFQSFTESPCDGLGLKCHQNIIFNIGLFRNITDPVDNQVKTCMPGCFSQEFNQLISDTSYPGMSTIKFRQDFCYVVNKLKVSCRDRYKRLYIQDEYENLCDGILVADEQQACDEKLHYHSDRIEKNKTRSERYKFEDDVVDYMSKNIAILNLFINKPSVIGIQSDVSVTPEELIANVGGILGLSIGASIITLMEILWHIMLFVVAKFNNIMRPPRKLGFYNACSTCTKT